MAEGRSVKVEPKGELDDPNHCIKVVWGSGGAVIVSVHEWDEDHGIVLTRDQAKELIGHLAEFVGTSG